MADKHLDRVLSSLSETQNSPAAFARKTLTLAKSITKHEDVSFIFDICEKHQMCGIVDNIHISMSQIGDIVRHLHKEIEASVRSLLYGASLPPSFYSHLSALTDSIQDHDSGSSFLSQGATRLRARKYAMWLFQTITKYNPTGKAAFTPRPSAPHDANVSVFGRTITKTAVESWLANTKDIQDKLLACTHLSSGSPGRATELETLKLCNTDYALRNVYISQGIVTIVTRYSKLRALTNWDRVIPRFPDPVTSRLFLTYLLMFRTLETIFVRALYGIPAMKSHMQALFVERGSSYAAERIRDVIRGTFRSHSLPIEFNHFRHFTAGMIPIIASNSLGIMKEELITEASAVAHLQAGHSVAVAEHIYARKPTDLPSLTSTALTKYRVFSYEWHRRVGFNQESSQASCLMLPSPQPVPLDFTNSISNSISSAVSRAIKEQFDLHAPSLAFQKRPLPFSSPTSPVQKRPKAAHEMLPPMQLPLEDSLLSYLPSLRLCLQDPNAMFRSPTQLQATVSMAKAEHDVLLIMPTGSRKTLSFLLPVLLESSTCSTVIFVPLAALVHEYVEKCKRISISVVTWAQRQTLAQVYIISDDQSRAEIEKFLRNLEEHGRLRRIVFDEVHLYLLWKHFRSSFRRLPYALKAGVQLLQFVFCTATLPPPQRKSLLEFFDLPSAVLYAESTARHNFKYRVTDTSPQTGAQVGGQFLSSELIVTNELCKQLLIVCRDLSVESGGRILVFALYRNQVETVAQALAQHLTTNLDFNVPVRHYHAAMSSGDLHELHSFWKAENANIKVIVSTSAFGTGLDVPNVRAVFHLGGSNSLIEYVQETGRAGRDGKQALCSLIYNKSLADRHTAIVTKQDDHVLPSDAHLEDDRRQEWFLMLRYMSQTTKCRKNLLFRHIDGDAPPMCLFNQSSVNCDICDAYSAPHRPNPSSQPSSPISRPFSPLLQPRPLVPLQPFSIPSSSSPDEDVYLQFLSTPQLPSLDHPNTEQPNPPVSSPTQPILPVRRRLDFNTPSQRDPLSDFRNKVHSLRDLCVVCLVKDGAKNPASHRCKQMKNRCKRCFHLGHSLTQCQAFNPRRKNFCYGCSLSQVRGENIHKPGEFGAACYMGIARDIAWMLWADGLHTNSSFLTSLCAPEDAAQLQQLMRDSSDLKPFFVAWLKSSQDEVPNLVRLLVWWDEHI